MSRKFRYPATIWKKEGKGPAYFDKPSNCYRNVRERGINGKIVVYLIGRASDEDYAHEGKFSFVNGDKISVCGYRDTSLLFGTRVAEVPINKRKELGSKLRDSLSSIQCNFGEIVFWDKDFFKKSKTA